MTELCKKYLELEKKWLEGNPSPKQEELLLDEMDKIWYAMTPEEIKEIEV